MDDEEYEYVDVTIRYYRKLPKDPFDYSTVKYELLDVEAPGPIHSCLMRTAIEDYGDVDIDGEIQEIDKVGAWSNTK